jgi:hypothetical protein
MFQNVFAAILLLAICFFFYKRVLPNLRVFFLPALILKIGAGLAYGWLYVVYYGEVGDSLNYFHDAGRLLEVGRRDANAYWNVIFWNEYTPIWNTTLQLWQEPRAFWFVKLVSLLMWITTNYWILACYFSVLSFIGSWVLVEALIKHFPKTRLITVGAFLFVPSVVFFGAGLTKESLAVALLGIGIAQMLGNFSWRTLPILGICAWGLLQLKFYYLAFWAGSAFTMLLTYPIAKHFALPAWGQVSLYSCIALLGVLVASFAFDLDELLLMIALNHNTTYGHSHPNDLVHYSIYGGQGYISLDASWQSLLYNSPLAIEAGLFRPYVWEAQDKLKLLMSLENTVILGAFLAALGKLFTQKITLPDIFTRLFICAVLFFIVGLLVVVALASPNLGSLVRYKVVIQGWIVFGLGCVIFLPAKRKK